MKGTGILTGLLFLLCSCSVKPRDIVEGTDVCEFCKMTVMEKQYAAEFVTGKGRYYIFDDFSCMRRFLNADSILSGEIKEYYVSDFYHPDQLIQADKAYFYKSDSIHTPMSGNTIAVPDEASLLLLQQEMKGTRQTWDEVMHR